MDIAKPKSWVLGLLSLVTFLGFFYGFLTLAGGGIFIVAISVLPWIGLVIYTRKTRAVVWIGAAPILIYGLLLVAGLILSPFL
ncbi:MAG: hypothetical protein IIB87_03530 [Chloroflexi bacterium]|nr:hypothetical protein [Chloroflexota bacterium]